MLAINIPADGLFLAILGNAQGDLSCENCTRIMEAYINRHLEAKPDIIFLNVSYRRCLTPSQVFDSYLYNIETDENGFAVRDENGETVKTFSPVLQNGTKYFQSFSDCARSLLLSGIDIYQTTVETIRRSGCKVFLSIRVNDLHFTDNPAINSGFATKDGGKHTIGKYGGSLDYSQAAVQTYFLEYIRELLNTYPVDGIELDYLRYPGLLPEKCRSDFSILNTYMKRVRTLLDAYNPALQIAVRVLCNESDNLRDGVDVAQWIADGTADILTISNFYIPTNYEPPVSQWRGSIRAKNRENRKYHLLCASDWAVSCLEGFDIPMTPSLVRAFASTCRYKGADGIYLFNFFEEDSASSWELLPNGQLQTCFSQRILAANHPEDLPRRYIHIGDSNTRYPISLHSSETYRFSQHIETPFHACKLTVGCDVAAPLRLQVNAAEPLALTEDPVFKDFAYAPEKKQLFIYAVSQAAPHVFSAYFPSTALQDTDFSIALQNPSDQPVNILWLEISCE